MKTGPEMEDFMTWFMSESPEVQQDYLQFLKGKAPNMKSQLIDKLQKEGILGFLKNIRTRKLMQEIVVNKYR